MKRFFLIGIVAMLAACNTKPAPTTAVLASMISYKAALTLAAKYNDLPRCVANGPILCSDLAVVQQLRRADDAAFAAMNAAEKVVLTPGISSSAITAAKASAEQAVVAFVQVLQAYDIK